ncbi:hypothetical protein JOF36_003853 [Pseudonocardia parietis]|uniref:LigA n=1 Tax=Pseudonocardia parietis TaxID=570936 RepID=A0ABS4VW46_9PSEU|nr:hypothetical protein [Pseudonocardia parietis]
MVQFDQSCAVGRRGDRVPGDRGAGGGEQRVERGRLGHPPERASCQRRLDPVATPLRPQRDPAAGGSAGVGDGGTVVSCPAHRSGVLRGLILHAARSFRVPANGTAGSPRSGVTPSRLGASDHFRRARRGDRPRGATSAAAGGAGPALTHGPVRECTAGGGPRPRRRWRLGQGSGRRSRRGCRTGSERRRRDPRPVRRSCRWPGQSGPGRPRRLVAGWSGPNVGRCRGGRLQKRSPVIRSGEPAQLPASRDRERTARPSRCTGGWCTVTAGRRAQRPGAGEPGHGRAAARLLAGPSAFALRAIRPDRAGRRRPTLARTWFARETGRAMVAVRALEGVSGQGHQPRTPARGYGSSSCP